MSIVISASSTAAKFAPNSHKKNSNSFKPAPNFHAKAK